MKIGIIGSGSWGSALAIHFGKLGFSVVQWCLETEIAEGINRNRRNVKYLTEFVYPETVVATSSFDDFFNLCGDTVFSVIPTQFCRSLWKGISNEIKNRNFIVASKGIEISSLKTLSEVFKEVAGNSKRYFVLSGPTFAKEVAEGLPSAAVLAGFDKEKTFELTNVLNSTSFRLYVSEDVKGVELGGALKNVIAIAAGISDGMKLGNNARAALITRGLHEIKNLGVRLGADEKTFYGLSGMGDLILTCTSNLSRNRRYGLSIGSGDYSVEEKYVVEGVHTVEAVVKLSHIYKVSMPISESVYACVHKGADPRDVLKHLLSRPVKEEAL